MRKLALSALFCILFSSLVGAQTIDPSPDRPDVEKWNIYSKSNISIRISDKVSYYLGFDIIYQNPENKNEFIRQVKVLIPFIAVKSHSTQDRNYVDTMTAYVTDGAERDLLKAYSLKSDPVLYVRWSVKNDYERGTLKLDGENEVWFWNSFGIWVYGRNVKIKLDYLSQTFANLRNELIIVGVKYSLSQTDYNAREIPYAYISVAVKASKGVK